MPALEEHHPRNEVESLDLLDRALIEPLRLVDLALLHQDLREDVVRVERCEESTDIVLLRVGDRSEGEGLGETIATLVVSAHRLDGEDVHVEVATRIRFERVLDEFLDPLHCGVILMEERCTHAEPQERGEGREAIGGHLIL